VTDRISLTVEEAAELLGISRGLAYEAVRVGALPSVRIGRRILVPTARLLAMFDEGANGAAVTGLTKGSD
jgi:excisionase family DNA binding protein